MSQVMARVALVVAVLAVGLGFAACESGTGPEDQAVVSVGFRAGGPAVATRIAPAGGEPAASLAARAVELEGSNGTLTLDEIWLIVAEFELERTDGACEDDNGDEDDDEEDDGDDEEDCEEFEASPAFVSLPLDGSVEPAVTQAVAPGVYQELEFEVEDIEIDDDDEAVEVGALFAEIRAQFPDWPEKASMLATGTFTPTGGAPAPFRVFFEAEIEIERAFDPPLDLTEGEEASVMVVVDPAALFLRSDGTVLDLSRFDGQLLEFELEMGEGFSDIEFDDDGDDGEEDGEDGEED